MSWFEFGENEAKQNNQQNKQTNNKTNKPDRTVTKWVRIVSSEKYVKKDAPSYVQYVFKPGWSVEGIVEKITEGTMKIKDREIPTDVIVIRNSTQKYGFAIPHSRFYTWLCRGIPAEGKKAKVEYLGEIKINNGNVKVLAIEFMNNE